MTCYLANTLLSIPGYVIYRLDRQTLRPNEANVVKKGGGLAVFVKEDIHVDNSTLDHLNKSNENIELQCLMIRPPSQKRLILLNVYRPPSGNHQDFLDVLSETMDQIPLIDNLETFVLGDFNIDLSTPQNAHAITLIENFQSISFAQKVTDPTRHARNNRPTLLDHIYTNSQCIADSGNITLNISDHDLVFVIRKKGKAEKTNLSFKGRSYRQYDKEAFQEKLNSQNWDPFYNSNDPDHAWDFLLNTIRSEIETMCPLRDIKIKKQKDPWITNELLELINDKNDLLADAKGNQNLENWDNARTARNLVASMIKDAKREYLISEIENDYDPGKFWKRLHAMFPDKPSTGKINLIDPTTDEMVQEHLIPGYANAFFTSIGPNIIRDTGFDMKNWSYKGTVYPTVFSLHEVRIEETLSEIKNLKVSKPSGIENLSTKVIKDALWILAHQFTWLLNMSICMAKVPMEWKRAKISLIPKDGNLNDINNFRPIAILPVVSKVMEHIIQAQTMLYIEENDILDVHQGGFRKNNSTTATTISMLGDIYINLNNQQLTYAIFIDFRKAFDSINHDILLGKLVKLGFCRSTVDWYKSYLANRTQYTVVNGISSDTLDITCGVPQGSVLGPMLFLLFINDLKSSINLSGHKLYADDTVLYSKLTQENDAILRSNIQTDLDNITPWCKNNAILMNVKKTKSMVFGTRQRLKEVPKPLFRVDDRILECVPSYKYLGTFLDSELNFIRQSNETIKSVSYKLYFLGKIKKILNTDILIRLYNSYIRPYFDYNDIFLETTNARQYDRLVRFQRRCLRGCLPGNLKLDRNEIYSVTGINKLSDRADAHLLKIMYKRAQMEEYLVENEGRTRLHYGPVLTVPFQNNELFKKSVLFRGSSLWNTLIPEERNIPTFDSFKTMLKEKLDQKLL